MSLEIGLFENIIEALADGEPYDAYWPLLHTIACTSKQLRDFVRAYLAHRLASDRSEFAALLAGPMHPILAPDPAPLRAKPFALDQDPAGAPYIINIAAQKKPLGEFGGITVFDIVEKATVRVLDLNQINAPEQLYTTDYAANSCPAPGRRCFTFTNDYDSGGGSGAVTVTVHPDNFNMPLPPKQYVKIHSFHTGGTTYLICLTKEPLFPGQGGPVFGHAEVIDASAPDPSEWFHVPQIRLGRVVELACTADTLVYVRLEDRLDIQTIEGFNPVTGFFHVLSHYHLKTRTRTDHPSTRTWAQQFLEPFRLQILTPHGWVLAHLYGGDRAEHRYTVYNVLHTDAQQMAAQPFTPHNFSLARAIPFSTLGYILAVENADPLLDEPLRLVVYRMHFARDNTALTLVRDASTPAFQDPFGLRLEPYRFARIQTLRIRDAQTPPRDIICLRYTDSPWSDTARFVGSIYLIDPHRPLKCRFD